MIVLVYSILLLGGLVLGQMIDVSSMSSLIKFATAVCLSYIMIEVGLEFSVDPRPVRSYGWDAFFALAAAVVPAMLWFFYFMIVLGGPWQPAVIGGLSSAPTSAGILFAMLLAAKLSSTWVFKKARTLAVLDDLATVLLLCPLQIIIHGFEIRSVAAVVLVAFFILASFRWKNTIPWPIGQKALVVYAAVLTGSVTAIQITTHIHLDVLIPAFMLGCLIRLSDTHETTEASTHFSLDTLIKGGFMLLVGLSFPRVDFASMPIHTTIIHVLVLTVLANLGKAFLLFCYRDEVSMRERLALSVAMFPRGEVGAAVLLIGLGYGFGGVISSLAMLSLALNLVLTGLFIWIVIKLLSPTKR